MKGFLLWVATLLSVFTTFVRALNIGYVVELYLLSCIAYVIMCVYERERRLIALNAFYLIMALVGAFRW